MKNKEEKKEELYNELNIEINEETEKITNEEKIVKKNHKNINENIFLKKEGNKIIIYDGDEFSE